MREDFANINKLGFGCMRLPLTDPADQKSIDIEQLKTMVDEFIATGGTYFDTAFVYHEGASETALKEALTSRYPREAYTVATKCLAWALPDAESAKACLDTSLERMGIDYIDFYLLHNVGGPRTAVFDKFGMWDFVKEMKAAGKIRHYGFSMHDDAKCLEELLSAHPDVDFIQLQVNYLDWDDPVVQSRKLMDVAAKFDKPVVVMEPARGGQLVNLPDRVADVFKKAAPDESLASWAYRFCYTKPGVMAVLSGMSNIEQMRENLADFKKHGSTPFTAEEQATFEAAVEALHAVPTVPCTNCRYCVKGCPQNIAIPNIMALLNLEAYTGNREFTKGQYSWQAKAPASECIQCGACEAMCPQKIDIINQLETAAERYE